MTTWYRRKGDVGDTIVMKLSGINNLNNVTDVKGHVRLEGGTAVVLTGAVTDAPNNEVTIQLGATAGQAWLPTADEGIFHFEVQVTFNDGKVLTWPSRKHADRIVVSDQLA